ncbi:MAG: chemotaxis protein CheB, partial [Azoarcus sp.]|nr:chemotaxis protein CheB [Azoarcus sp.]
MEKKESAPDAQAPAPSSVTARHTNAFPIVGIGASAGGLEALEQFLSTVPVDSGMAYVIVQHLDPTHKGMMPELLQRATTLPVMQVKNRLKVKPNHIYVIPPNREMSILHGTLYLFEPTTPRGQRLPIDLFLHSLAEDRRQQAVAVILSGMGSDGSAGMRAVKENGGLAVAQEPASGAYPSMPQSAIDTGLVDIVAAPNELPARIIGHVKHVSAHPETVIDNLLQSGLEKVLILLRARNGHDFSLYKKSTLYRRIERRMDVHQIDRIATYVRFLQENPQEIDLLFREFLIGVTNFFRDPQAWERLRDLAFPQLFARSPAGRPMRAWVAGCSTGEEAYSLAMTFREAIDKHQPAGRFSLQIFATDLDGDAIDRARQGRYPSSIANEVSADRLARFFIATDDAYLVGKEIREMVIFAPQNMIQDPPFTKLDLLLCRNVLIYFGPELQKKLLPLFHYSLAPGGIMFLGNSETVGSESELFSTIDIKGRLFRRIDKPPQKLGIDFPSTFQSHHGSASDTKSLPPSANLQTLADQLLLEQFSPAAVLVNGRGDIVYINGRTGHYLEPAAGKANWNIHAMAREGLRQELGAALHQVTRNRGRVERADLRVVDEGKTRAVDLTVQMIEAPEQLCGMVMIAFSETHQQPDHGPQDKKPRSMKQSAMEHQLQQAHDEVRTLREEMQTSQEELKSTNEELQSTNEELQSTNEELTTSKEEMQSLNEELQTVNVEL